MKKISLLLLFAVVCSCGRYVAKIKTPLVIPGKGLSYQVSGFRTFKLWGYGSSALHAGPTNHFFAVYLSIKNNSTRTIRRIAPNVLLKTENGGWHQAAAGRMRVFERFSPGASKNRIYAYNIPETDQPTLLMLPNKQFLDLSKLTGVVK